MKKKICLPARKKRPNKKKRFRRFQIFKNVELFLCSFKKKIRFLIHPLRQSGDSIQLMFKKAVG